MKHVQKLALSIAAIGAAIGVSFGANAETLNWASFKSAASDEALVVAAKWWADELEKRTDGEYKVRFHWSGSLAGIREIPDAVGSGIADIGAVATPYFVDQLYINNVQAFYLPQPHSAAEIIDLSQSWLDRFPQFSEEYERANLKIIGLRPFANYGLLCVKPIRSIEEFKGTRIRGFGRAMPALIKALGAVPVTMGTTDAYEALERGILDCTPTDPSLAVGYKFTEVAKYYLQVPIGATWGQHLVMNKSKFDGLPKEIQDIVIQLGVEHDKMLSDLIGEGEKSIIDSWKAGSDIEVISFSEDAFDPIVESNDAILELRRSWVEEATKRGVPGQQIADELTGKTKP